MRRDTPTSGFTLIETLVAMMVLALLAGVLLRGVVAARDDAAWSADRAAGTLLATSVLDEAVGNRLLRDGAYRGERDGRHWVLTAAPAGRAVRLPPPQADAPPPSWRPQRLTVTVESPRRPVVLETVRLAAMP